VPSRTELAELAARQGLELVGVTHAGPLPEARRHMEASVAAGRMARMDWMGGDRPAIATDPTALDPAARTVIVVAAPYVGPERGEWDEGADALRRALAPVLAGQPAAPIGRIARYADGRDYHASLRTRLEALAASLEGEGLPTGEVAYVDDRPLAERALAARAGLGWIGKNANLLTHARAGSWVFLGALLTSAELPTDEPVRTSCGGCTRCLAGCPTGAIVAPQTIDARRCISYLTIEHPGELAAWESAAVGDWIFGCDVCQEVCPVNGQAEDSGPLLVPLVPLIAWLLPMSGRAFHRAVRETALTRAGRHRLLRNAIAALGNAHDIPDGTEPILRHAADDRRAEVRAEARRVLDRLDGRGS
jgi:epoxyqueuosine reductase